MGRRHPGRQVRPGRGVEFADELVQFVELGADGRNPNRPLLQRGELQVQASQFALGRDQHRGNRCLGDIEPERLERGAVRLGKRLDRLGGKDETDRRRQGRPRLQRRALHGLQLAGDRTDRTHFDPFHGPCANLVDELRPEQFDGGGGARCGRHRRLGSGGHGECCRRNLRERADQAFQRLDAVTQLLPIRVAVGRRGWWVVLASALAGDGDGRAEQGWFLQGGPHRAGILQRRLVGGDAFDQRHQAQRRFEPLGFHRPVPRQQLRGDQIVGEPVAVLGKGGQLHHLSGRLAEDVLDRLGYLRRRRVEQARQRRLERDQLTADAEIAQGADIAGRRNQLGRGCLLRLLAIRSGVGGRELAREVSRRLHRHRGAGRGRAKEEKPEDLVHAERPGGSMDVPITRDTNSRQWTKQIIASWAHIANRREAVPG